MNQLVDTGADTHSNLNLRDENPLVRAIHQALNSKGALDIIVIDLKGKSDIADAMVIATGTSTRHVSSLADYAEEAIESQGDTALAIEGKEQGNWVIVDHPRVMVHLFRAEMRELYALEKMWGEAIDEDAEIEVLH